MDVLVTGGTGFVGANVARALVSDGHAVRVLARPTSERTALAGCQAEVIAGDLEDPVPRQLRSRFFADLLRRAPLHAACLLCA